MHHIQKYERVMAIGCRHGDLANLAVCQQILDFKKRFKPKHRFDLGDVVDTAAFRHGAKGTADETRPVDPDKISAVTWFEQYEPTHLAWGNHDWRLFNWMNHPSAIISHSAATVWNDLNKTLARLKCETLPYILRKNWFELGGMYWGHGQFFNETALRQHAEYLGGPCVMAHIHAPQVAQGRTRDWSQSFCVGMLADIEKLSYADGNRSTGRWGAGCVWGEVSEKRAHLHLTAAAPGEDLRFPL